MRSHGRASAYVRGRGQQHEVNEVPSGNGQIRDIAGIDHLADFGFLRIHSLHGLLNFDSLVSCLDRQNYRNGGILTDREGEHGLIGAELIGIHRDLIIARRQAGKDRDSRRGREQGSFCTGFEIPQSDSRARDHATRGVGYGEVERSQLLRSQVNRQQQGQTERTAEYATETLFHRCPPTGSPIAGPPKTGWLRKLTCVSECGTHYLRANGGGNTRKTLEIARARRPCTVGFWSRQQSREEADAMGDETWSITGLLSPAWRRRTHSVPRTDLRNGTGLCRWLAMDCDCARNFRRAQRNRLGEAVVNVNALHHTGGEFLTGGFRSSGGRGTR